ncbi:uncharacterized protein CANTADRAFT_151019 [Suhomyces tanzawaensis NRRL Y-17324]|uniref:Uncharacterized protein n=1 Tax=Suhomyces tanzawaensis NRRL Y-17324 TaxID=984487 RepID=A0A1E4SLS4_9ASCO|nr:uncharacterized protein CANTADRAFT_151019 [Suhomyces tanzawaensis NRRL Y-17324]ODV80476.1 hypothetical protein CANTADRAFT_151019 [Suhomyces tanzawaensis NRRL Y-17324]
MSSSKVEIIGYNISQFGEFISYPIIYFAPSILRGELLDDAWKEYFDRRVFFVLRIEQFRSWTLAQLLFWVLQAKKFSNKNQSPDEKRLVLVEITVKFHPCKFRFCNLVN